MQYSTFLLRSPNSRSLFSDEPIAEGNRLSIMQELELEEVICEIIEFVPAGSPENHYRNLLIRTCQYQEKILPIIKKYAAEKLTIQFMDDYDYEIGPTVIWKCCLNTILINAG